MLILRRSLAVAGLSALPALALAHTDAGLAGGLLHGLLHPLSGLDHLLAMVAVGLWAAQLGGRALWAVPMAFVLALLAGGALGMTGVMLPLVEQGIVASVLVLGLLIAGALRLPLAVGAALVGVCALFHGHAHGTELPALASGLSYAAGFALATAALHGVGIGLGRVLHHTAAGLPRLAGATVAVGGLALLLG